MKRRDLLTALGCASSLSLLGLHAPGWAQAVSRRADSLSDRVLFLVELKGGNDGLNAVVPYADPLYYQLRNSLSIRRDDVLQLDSAAGLHPELRALLPLWEKGELAIVQGVGYPQPNLSHFRSIEIWETSSRSNEYLTDGWVARAMKAGISARANFTAEGVLVGMNDFGPLAGARAVSLNNPQAFLNQSRLAQPVDLRLAAGNRALQHLLQVEDEIGQAAQGLRGERYGFVTEFPQGAFGNSLRAAAQVVASQRGRAGVPVVAVSLGSFDTHQNQMGTHANLLRQLGEGIAALKGAMMELGAWDRTLIMTFSEFGRRPRQNNSNGTDHGTAAPHFLAGGAVRGGIFGQRPDLARLDGTQNLLFTTDFRQLYATVAQSWWGVSAEPVVRGAFDRLPLLKT